MRGGGVRLGCTKVIDADEEIAKAVALAKEVEQVVICAGLTVSTEPRTSNITAKSNEELISVSMQAEWESEGFDRADMALPGRTNDLIRAVSAANPRTAVVIQSGTPVEMPWAAAVPALVQAPYGGNEGAAPSGKLVYTIPERVEDNPAFLNFGSENGRVLYGEDVYVGYRFYEKTKRAPLFPFGHGLSYTAFELGGFQVSQEQQQQQQQHNDRAAEEMVKVAVGVKNVGEVAGAAVVQVYVAQQRPSINRPPKELKGFEKIHLEPKGVGNVTVDIPQRYAASYWDEDAGKWIMEAGTYDVLVGQSSVDVALAGTFTVEKTSWWLGL
ncbi:glycoside hydrolase family 3 protein [Apiospora aurea]|uniref:beta-glucosidase n=1 Tax=Apiospora aurea TaxID=335848 RepID=A0ABR1QAC6_9PEZI